VIDAFDERQDDSEPPPWAGPSGIETLRPARRPPSQQPSGGQRLDTGPGQAEEPEQNAWPGPGQPGRLRRGPRRGRAAAARRRRSKRRLVTWGAVAIAVVVATGLGFYLAQSPAKKGPFVTKLQKGEFRAVPDACKVVGATVLHQIMHGAPRSIQPQQGQAQSECTFTVDASPVFRVMNVNLAAMRASLVPVGNGGATANARFNFTRQAAQLRKPPKHTAQPPASTTAVPGLGQQAIIAVQTFGDSAATDKVTVIVRFRNVLITVSLQGQSGHGFGPVTTGELRSGALTVARAALSGVKGEPVV